MKVFGGNYGDRANQENNAYILVMPMVVTMMMMTLLMVMTNLIWVLYKGVIMKTMLTMMLIPLNTIDVIFDMTIRIMRM